MPFCLWVMAHYHQNFEEALWITASGLEDADTTCAIVGGAIALSTSCIPAAWIQAREPLPPLSLQPL